MPKTLAEAIAPLLIINWIFGIGVIEYPIGTPRRIISVIWSILNFVMYLGLLRMTNFSEIVTIHGSKMVAHNYRILNTVVYVVFITVSMCLAHMKAQVLKVSREKIILMNDRMQTLGVPDDNEAFFQARLIETCLSLAYIFILMTLDFKYIGFDLPSESSRIGFLMSSHYLMIFISIVDSNFSSGIRYVGRRFRHLNTLLEDLDSADNTKTADTQQMNDQYQCYASVINEIRRDYSVGFKTAEKQWLLYVIRETRKIHRGFCKLVTELCEAFGIQILFSLALSFGMIITLLYISYIATTTVSSLDILTTGFWIAKIMPSLWIMFYATKIFLIVHACETTSCEANRSGVLISKLLDATACDEDIRDEIETFSFQLIQNPLNFTAHGFFTLNYSLVREIIGSAATYLVIMIQMRYIYEPKGVNSIPNSTILVEANDLD